MDKDVVYGYIEYYVTISRDLCCFLREPLKEQHYFFFSKDSQLNYTENYKSLRCL